MTDDDVCMLDGTGGQALVDVLAFGVNDAGGATPEATALSGTVTVTAIGPGHVAGSFDVQLGAVDETADTIDTQHPAPFSGTFDVTSCEGDAGP